MTSFKLIFVGGQAKAKSNFELICLPNFFCVQDFLRNSNRCHYFLRNLDFPNIAFKNSVTNFYGFSAFLVQSKKCDTALTFCMEIVFSARLYHRFRLFDTLRNSYFCIFEKKINFLGTKNKKMDKGKNVLHTKPFCVSSDFHLHFASKLYFDGFLDYFRADRFANCYGKPEDI